jgi:hypothetical protein
MPRVPGTMRTAFKEIVCPTSGRVITVPFNPESDPLHHLKLDPVHRAAADAYQGDVEVASGARRAQGDGISWKGRKGLSDGQRRQANRLARAHAALGPDRARLIHAALIDGQIPPASERELRSALDRLARVYGMISSPARTTNSKGEKYVSN